MDMKKSLSLLLTALMIISLAGCGGVSKEQYDAVRAERDALKQKLEELRNSPKEPDTVQLKLKGTFTATVRAMSPDYVSDDTTPLMAVVTLFQSTPFMIYTGDFTERLEAGETYVFEIKEQVVEIPLSEYEIGYPAPEVVIPQYNLRLSGFRESVESDWGLDSVHLVYELCDET